MGVEVCGIPLAAPAFQLSPAQLEAAILQQRQRGRTGAGWISTRGRGGLHRLFSNKTQKLVKPCVMPLSLEQPRPSERVSLLQPAQPAGQRH